MCARMWISSWREERKWHFLNSEVRGSALPTSAHTHTNSLSPTSDCRRQTFPWLVPAHSHTLVLLFHEDWPSHLWPGPSPCRSYYLMFQICSQPHSLRYELQRPLLIVPGATACLRALHWVGQPWVKGASRFPPEAEEGPLQSLLWPLLWSCCSRRASRGFYVDVSMWPP